jgi:hypothetical protein
MKKFQILFGAIILVVCMAFQASAQTVYITRTGAKYHRDGCRYLSQSKIAIPLSEAKRNGYTPCKVCTPRGIMEGEDDGAGRYELVNNNLWHGDSNTSKHAFLLCSSSEELAVAVQVIRLRRIYRRPIAMTAPSDRSASVPIAKTVLPLPRLGQERAQVMVA